MEKFVEKIEADAKRSARLISECQRLCFDLSDWADKYVSTRNEEYLKAARKALRRLTDYSLQCEKVVSSAASYFTKFSYYDSPELYDRAFKAFVEAKEAFQDVDGWLCESSRYLDSKTKS